jgi:acyl carrier protein
MSNEAGLREEVKQVIFGELGITRLSAAELPNHAPLFGEEGLALDSLDGLQIAAAVEEHFKLRLPEGDEVRPVLRCVDSIADYITLKRGGV